MSYLMWSITLFLPNVENRQITNIMTLICCGEIPIFIVFVSPNLFIDGNNLGTDAVGNKLPNFTKPTHT